ncbi:hypothetical protein [Thiolapillus sp.]
MKLLPHHRAFYLVILLLGLVMPGSVLAEAGSLAATPYSHSDDDDEYALSIKEAEWKEDKSQLKVEGKGINGQKVMLLSVASGQVLGEATIKSGKWKIKVTLKDVVPCRVRAESPGAYDEEEVKNAPRNCDLGGDDPPSSSFVSIKEAKWKEDKSQLKAEGKGENGQKVTLLSVASGQKLGEATIESGKWKIKVTLEGVVPCRVRARLADGSFDEEDVEKAPRNCDAGGSNPPPPVTGSYTVLAANDLGMHCADQDFRMFSILPPYNVLNAQVLRKGQEPELLEPKDGIYLTYRAVPSNIVDANQPHLPPIATDSVTSTNQNDLPKGIFKSNFWDIASGPTGLAIGFLAYEKLYPPGVLAAFPFEPDLGLPAPNVEEFYLRNPGNLIAEQAEMPGKGAPYAANQAKPFHGFVEDYPFFVNFPFGYTVRDFQRFAAEGIPTGYIDDEGRTNAYPLMRVEAKDGSGRVLASIDVVTPVASEADCAICHASQSVCDYDQTNTLVCDDIANFKYSSVDFLTDASMVLGDTPEQQVINAAKINIMRLHDYKNGTNLAPLNDDGTNADGSTPNVVCANCHYSAALDLAHLGPNDDNGKKQTQHISMSRAMHSVHGNLPNADPALYGDLFPVMPPPDQRGSLDVEALLGATCYACHPGKRSKCLRGAMGGAGVVCQDCHGQMTQVGDDFSENFASMPFPAGANMAKRVPWASEPKCQSCHIGDVMQVAKLKRDGRLQDVLVNAVDSKGNPDGLRLRMTYRQSDHIANGGGANLALLDFPNSRFASDEALYRLSGANDDKGHGELACSSCHGSTHAIWPNKNPFSNDNKAAIDLQGHAGTITECSVCHTGDLGNTLEGPHGMHPVGNTRFSAGGHEHLAEHDKDACRACHGQNGEGSVLSRAAVDRVLDKDDDGKKTVFVAKGEPVTCTLCHKNKL